MEFILTSLLSIFAKLFKFLFEIGSSFILDKESYGYFSVLLSFVLIFSRFSTFGINNLVIREIHLLDRKSFKEFLFFMIFVPLGVSVVLYLVSFYFSFQYKELVVLISLIYSYVIIFSSLLRANSKVKEWMFFQDISWYLILFVFLLGVYLIFQRINLFYLLIFYFLSLLLNFVILIIFLKKEKIINFSLSVSKKVFFYIKEALPIILTGTTYLILARIDIIMLAKYIDMKIVGEYNIIARISVQVLFFYQIIISIFMPKLAKMFAEKKDINYIKNFYRKIMFFGGISVLGVSIIIFILFKYFNLFDILKISLKEELLKVFIIFSFSYIVYAFISVYSYILLYIKKQKWEYLNNLVILIVGIGLNFILIPKYGVVGATLASVIAILLGNILEMIEVKYFIKDYQ